MLSNSAIAFAKHAQEKAALSAHLVMTNRSYTPLLERQAATMWYAHARASMGISDADQLYS